jgi:cyclophilin family peptidyl-prolyl cis-trans isomerase/HEAT repeat protein
MVRQRALPALVVLLAAASANAQFPDTAALRAKLRSRDVDVQRFALLELGRFELSSLIPAIVPSLQSPLPEVRAQAADAIGQAAQGWRTVPPNTRSTVSPESVVETLVARLKAEPEALVRAAITEAIGRLPYTTAGQVATAMTALVQTAPGDTVTDRLGIAAGLEETVRLNRTLLPAAAGFVPRLRTLAASDPSRDARVRRLAIEALNNLGDPDAVDDPLVARVASDPDMQVRRLAMRAAASRASSNVALEVLARGTKDEAAMVRMEALGALGSLGDESVCQAARFATDDRDMHVVLRAFDELARCGQSAEDVALLEQAVNDLSQVGNPRGWHRTAHALVALAAAQPERARMLLAQFVSSKNWALRMYAARAATTLRDQASLEQLVGDADANVKDAANTGLVVLGMRKETRPPVARGVAARSELNAADLRNLSLLRARVTIRDIGTFEMALLPVEAPLTVTRVVSLAEAGRYNGLVIQRVLPNVAVEVDTPPEDSSGLAVLTRDEAGPWPHVRGAVGINDESGFFIDLSDNPQFNHQFTVFAQLLSGMDVVDALLEGDIIERVDIVKP